MNKRVVPAVVLGCALALSACGSGGASTGAGADGRKQVTIGTLPIMPTAVIHMGIEKGYFRDAGLDVKVETGQGGAALIPAVMAGTMQFATGNPVSLLTARDKGLDVRVVASYTYDTDKGAHAVLAKKDSGIESARDLAGKTVAINTLRSMGDLHIMDAVEKDGGDPSKVKFVELGFPNMEAALSSGQVDAAWTPEPFMTIIQKAGYDVVSYPGVESVKGHPTMLFFTSGNLIQQDQKTVDAMTTAINQSMDYAQDHPDEVRTVAADKLKIDPALARAVVLEDVGGAVREKEIEATGKLMEQFDFIPKAADVDGLLQSTKDVG